jgi:8-oxo-dGTP pyrophosphatase MutT (NUDIX family)
MVINAKLIWNNKEYGIEYHDADTFADLPALPVTQAYGICFCEDKLLIGQRAKNGSWGHLGGSVEPGETPEQTLRREMKEESNMQVIAFTPLGYQIVTDPAGNRHIQLRYACTVSPIGKFIADPDVHDSGGIVAIKLIEPSEYKNYFDWGEIGDCIVARALELKTKLTNL